MTRTPTGFSVKLFISYAHQNKVWMKHLEPLVCSFPYDDRLTAMRADLTCVHAWHDKELTVGNPWDDTIRKELDEMDVFVPLVSADFFASWYIQNVELKRARERHDGEGLLVVPILLYDVNLLQKCAFLHQFKSVPASDRWWSRYKDRKEAHRPIDDALWAAIAQVRQRKAKV